MVVHVPLRQLLCQSLAKVLLSHGPATGSRTALGDEYSEGQREMCRGTFKSRSGRTAQHFGATIFGLKESRGSGGHSPIQSTPRTGTDSHITKSPATLLGGSLSHQLARAARSCTLRVAGSSALHSSTRLSELVLVAGLKGLSETWLRGIPTCWHSLA